MFKNINPGDFLFAICGVGCRILEGKIDGAKRFKMGPGEIRHGRAFSFSVGFKTYVRFVCNKVGGYEMSGVKVI